MVCLVDTLASTSSIAGKKKKKSWNQVTPLGKACCAATE